MKRYRLVPAVYDGNKEWLFQERHAFFWWNYYSQFRGSKTEALELLAHLNGEIY